MRLYQIGLGVPGSFVGGQFGLSATHGKIARATRSFGTGSARDNPRLTFERQVSRIEESPMQSDLKITGVEAIYLRLPEVKTQCDSGQDALIVKVSTDAGITGYGEVDSIPLAAKGCIEGPFSHTTATGLAHVVIGEDPFRTEYLWHKMYRANIYGGRRGIGIHAMSGIDLALWDIKGKALGMPVWKLLGGGFRKSLRAYASSLFGATPSETGQRARRFADQGFTAVKFGWDPMGQDAKTDVALVREARAGLGDEPRPDDRRRTGLRCQDRHSARPGVRAI